MLFNKKNFSKYIFIIIIFFIILFSDKNNGNNFKNDNYKPKISIFLPIYNKEKYLRRSIKSIQKQSLKDIEIILVNDGSTDNSLEILKEFAKEDSRIKIINNKNNSGLLFTRTMGILNSKGEYLMNLDPDDEYNGRNSLKTLYYKAKKLDVDFVTFFIIYLPNKKKSIKFSSFNQIIKQPKILESAFNMDDALIDYYITNKLIKRELLENAIKIFGNIIYKEKWNYHEDNIWSILIHKYAKSSVFVNKIVYRYYTKNSDSFMYNKGNSLDMKNLLLRNQIYQKIFDKKNETKYIIGGYVQLLKIIENNFNGIKENNETKKLYIKDLKNFMKKYNLSEEIKLNIKYMINNITL